MSQNPDSSFPSKISTFPVDGPLHSASAEPNKINFRQVTSPLYDPFKDAQSKKRANDGSISPSKGETNTKEKNLNPPDRDPNTDYK